MYSSACQLLARAELGADHLDIGPHRCFYCGSACDEQRAAKQWVKKTFTDWPNVATPDSDFVCVGCTLAADERWFRPGAEKLAKRRNFSWLLTETAALPLTKRELPQIRAVCLNPPSPPWALTIADSGQKQLLYRTPVNLSTERVTVQLETERVTFTPSELQSRMELAARLVPGIGKSRLCDDYWPTGVMLALAEIEPDAERLVEAWIRVRGEPLSRLAAFLVPSKTEMETTADD